MNRTLTKQELHNLAMNIVGRDLEKQGYEFIAVNSQLKKDPQFVCIDSSGQYYFVLVQVAIITEEPINYDVIWMETFKKHAHKQNAKVIFAGVGLGHPNNREKPPNLNEDYLLQYEGLKHLDVEMN